MSSRWELANRFVSDWAMRAEDPTVKDKTKGEHGGLMEVALCILQLSKDSLVTGGDETTSDTALLIRDSTFGSLLSTVICVQGVRPMDTAR